LQNGQFIRHDRPRSRDDRAVARYGHGRDWHDNDSGMGSGGRVICEKPNREAESSRGEALTEDSKPPLLYTLFSSNLYGTERMALATLSGLRDQFDPVLLAPPGPALKEAERRGFSCAPFRTRRELAGSIRHRLAAHRRLVFVATAITHSAIAVCLNAVYRRRLTHLHMVHGGNEEIRSYGRKWWLNRLDLMFVPVSGYARERLIAHGVRADKIRVIENFLPDERLRSIPRRGPFRGQGVGRVIVVTRLDPMKRVDLLLDALDRDPSLGSLSIRIFGGAANDEFRRRVEQRHPNVQLMGFQPDVSRELAASDLLVHTCPREAFGLAIVEAMAAGIPVLVPDRGGAGGLVTEDVDGYRFRADDVEDLARQLDRLRRVDADELNRIVAAGRATLETRFSETARLDDYRRIIRESET